MSRRNDNNISIAYQIKRDCFQASGHYKTITNDITATNYKIAINEFARWAKGQYSYAEIAKSPIEIIKQYTDKLISDGKSASTTHTKIAPICRAFRVYMTQIDNKPVRVVAQGKRASQGQSVRSQRESHNAQYARAYDFSCAVGIRESEIKRLTGADITVNEYGELCVIVRAGKGGKYQEQVILPQYRDTVQAAFDGVGKDERVFRTTEFSKNIAYHSNRAKLAQEAYSYYCSNYNNDSQRFRLAKQLWYKFKAAITDSNLSDKQIKSRKDRFAAELQNRDKPIKLRGDNLLKAQELGLPTELDRLSVMAVSVNHLSHWRTDVTVSNYLLKPTD